MKSTQIEANTKKPVVDKVAAQKRLEIQREKDAEMVRGRFKFYEVPGGSINFVYKCYKNEEPIRYDLVDGGIYTIPRGVARHLNKNTWYPEYTYMSLPGDSSNQKVQAGLNSMGGTGMKIGRKVSRMGFESLEFSDEDDLGQSGPSVFTAEMNTL